jgi:hypothetical protein
VLQQRDCASVPGSSSDVVGSAVNVGHVAALVAARGDIRTDIQGFDLDVCSYFLAALQCLYVSMLYNKHLRIFFSGLCVYFAEPWQF